MNPTEEKPATDLKAPMPLTRAQRRVLGALVEKAACTPEYYPLTANAVVTACNQKSNREPVTNYEPHVVDEALISLQQLGLVHRVFPATGRTERWKHVLKEVWDLDKAHRAVVAELLLRGPQTEGDLRSRSSRMAEIPTLEELRTLLDDLTKRGFVRRFSPEGQKRGVIWLHLLYPPEELAKLESRLATMAQEAPAEEHVHAPAPAAVPASESRFSALENELRETRSMVDELRERLDALAASHQELENQVQIMKRDLGG